MIRKGLIIRRPAWPAEDRTQWETGTRPSTLLEEGGPADRWRARTIEHYEFSYGRWLGWLAENDLLDEQYAPAYRITPDRLRAYIADLQKANKSESVFNRIIGLERAMAVLDPGYDRRLLRTASKKLPRGSDRSRKLAALQETAALFDLGVTLMQRAEAEVAPPRPRERAARYRDGLAIALMALRPLRAGNFIDMELGRSLLKIGDHWWLKYHPDAVKNHRHIEVPLPFELVPHLEQYLAVYRRQLMGNRYAGDWLWISTHYRPLWRGTMYQKIVGLTEAAFGRGLNPHLFRDAMATSLAINNPQIVNVAHAMLGNSLATTQRFYNLATSLHASRHVASSLDNLRTSLNESGIDKNRRTRR